MRSTSYVLVQQMHETGTKTTELEGMIALVLSISTFQDILVFHLLLPSS
jgi:hypothetical protein